MGEQRFLREHHIRSSHDFQLAYRQRCRASNGHIVVFGRKNGLMFARLGLSISRKVGPAVVRNRWKRRLREAFRLVRPQLPVGTDLVVVARDGKITLAQAKVGLTELARRVASQLAKEPRS